LQNVKLIDAKAGGGFRERPKARRKDGNGPFPGLMKRLASILLFMESGAGENARPASGSL